MTPQRKRAMRHDLFVKQKGLCAYCPKRLVKAESTLDHYLPRVLGGGDQFFNLRLACFACNNEKADMHPTEWERRIANRPRPVEAETRQEILARIAPRRHKESANAP